MAEGVEAEWIAMRADVRGVPYSEIEKLKGDAAKDPLQGRYTQGLDRLQRVMVGSNISASLHDPNLGFLAS